MFKDKEFEVNPSKLVYSKADGDKIEKPLN